MGLTWRDSGCLNQRLAGAPFLAERYGRFLEMPVTVVPQAVTG